MVEVTEFQRNVDSWMDACFGQTIKADQVERADRFIEEALELAQTIPGFDADRGHALVDYVFGREVGESFQEVGGVMVTLAALCNEINLDIQSAAACELSRVWTKVEAIRAKQAAKPTGSALPISQSIRTDVARIQALEAENARLRELVGDIADTAFTAPELNPSNYDHDQVCALNSAMNEIASMLPERVRQALADIPDLTTGQLSAIKALAGGRNQMEDPT